MYNLEVRKAFANYETKNGNHNRKNWMKNRTAFANYETTEIITEKIT